MIPTLFNSVWESVVFKYPLPVVLPLTIRYREMTYFVSDIKSDDTIETAVLILGDRELFLDYW